VLRWCVIPWSVEPFAGTVDGTWNAFTYRSCHCGHSDRMLKREEPRAAATLLKDIFLPCLNICFEPVSRGLIDRMLRDVY
jgi:hypothetical protein